MVVLILNKYSLCALIATAIISIAIAQQQEQDELVPPPNLFTVLINFFNAFEPTDIPKYVKFICRHPLRPQYVEVQMNDPYVAGKLDTSLPLAFFIHGYISHYREPMIHVVGEDFMRFVNSNLCMVDWTYLSNMGYSTTVSSTEYVGNYTADFIDYLVNGGHFRLMNITLIGFSLGAHISGLIGRRLKGRLPRIIALDPAGPFFTKFLWITAPKKLSPSCAEFVQVLHTDNTMFGNAQELGHADFYANGADAIQPGCGTGNETTIIKRWSCSHERSLGIFRASLNPANIFIGVQCSSFSDSLAIACANNPVSQFGLYSQNNVTGRIYFDTTDTFPYVVS